MTKKKKIDFNKIYEENYEKVFGHAFNKTNDYATAEDITQKTFMNLFKARNKFRGDSKPSTFLYIICKNEINQHFRQEKRRELEIKNNCITEMKFPNRTPETLQVQPVEAGMMDLYKLPLFNNLWQRIFEMRYNGYDNKEIAIIHNWTIPKVKSAYHRATKKLRKYYANEDPKKQIKTAKILKLRRKKKNTIARPLTQEYKKAVND